MRVCNVCEKEKPLSEFYKNAGCVGGYQPRCKECTKKASRDRGAAIQSDPVLLEKERKRGRDKYHRLYEGSGRADQERSKRWANRYPEKRAAALAAQHIRIPGKENHHWSYREEYYKDVINLTKKEHMKAHRFIIYDQERMMYRRFDNNELLDTKEKHLKFIKWCIKNKED